MIASNRARTEMLRSLPDEIESKFPVNDELSGTGTDAPDHILNGQPATTAAQGTEIEMQCEDHNDILREVAPAPPAEQNASPCLKALLTDGVMDRLMNQFTAGTAYPPHDGKLQTNTSLFKASFPVSQAFRLSASKHLKMLSKLTVPRLRRPQDQRTPPDQQAPSFLISQRLNVPKQALWKQLHVSTPIGITSNET